MAWCLKQVLFQNSPYWYMWGNEFIQFGISEKLIQFDFVKPEFIIHIPQFCSLLF